MATIRDVAKMAGVSISTVSLALNGSGPVSADTHQRIWDAAQKVGYSPNPLAQSLKVGRSRLIGVVMADISNPFFGQLLGGVERVGGEEGRAFRRGHRFRAGIEGRSHGLRRDRGLERGRYRGERGLGRWVGWGSSPTTWRRARPRSRERGRFRQLPGARSEALALTASGQPLLGFLWPVHGTGRVSAA